MGTEVRVELLRRTGICAVPGLDTEEVAEVRSYFAKSLVYVDAHIPETARKRGDRPCANLLDRARYSECICVELSRALLAPRLFEKAVGLTDVASAYLGASPAYAYSSNAFWTRPIGGVRPDIQDTHRDLDDERFLVLFCYLSDVKTDEDGPHALVGPDGVERKIYGPAGTMFLADTSHPHRGLKPTKGTRGIWWMRWGVSVPPAAYQWDKNYTTPGSAFGPRWTAVRTPMIEQAFKLLVAPND